jgi:Bacterial SH3 domain
MGQPKVGPDVFALSGRYPAGVLGDPKPIAERLARSADQRKSALQRTDSPTAPQPPRLRSAREPRASAVDRPVFRHRLLIAGLILAALVLCLILGVLWFGSTGGSAPGPAATIPEPQTKTPPPVLTALAGIEATAGEHVRFPIALDGTDGVPPRSIIAIRGLPPRSNFSEGRPYGDSEWNLKPDQIGDLNLALPTDANGAFTIGIALIAPDDGMIAEAKTLLEIAPPPTEPVAADESLASPGNGEAAAAALAPYGGDAIASAVGENGVAAEAAPAPDAGDGATDEEPTRMETASVPSADLSANKVGPADAGTTAGLGTVQPSVFVNLREGPSSSSPVLGVIAKGATLSVLDRKRGWVQVAAPETGKRGWIYSGLLVGESKTNYRIRRVAPAEAETKSESFWGRVGRWLSPSKEN